MPSHPSVLKYLRRHLILPPRRRWMKSLPRRRERLSYLDWARKQCSDWSHCSTKVFDRSRRSSHRVPNHPDIRGGIGGKGSNVGRHVCRGWHRNHAPSRTIPVQREGKSALLIWALHDIGARGPHVARGHRRYRKRSTSLRSTIFGRCRSERSTDGRPKCSTSGAVSFTPTAKTLFEATAATPNSASVVLLGSGLGWTLQVVAAFALKSRKL